jgi:peroxiredoxin Q/BCP
MAIGEGDRAPEICLETDSGDVFELSRMAGKNVVVYFYPKADTPGCTTEACEFRDAAPSFGEDAVVVGVSPDAVKSQAKFKGKYSLNFPLLADVGHKTAGDYGVWVEKSMYGKKSMGIERSTFLIGKDGTIKKIWRKVKAAGHAAEVLAAVRSSN